MPQTRQSNKSEAETAELPPKSFISPKILRQSSRLINNSVLANLHLTNTLPAKKEAIDKLLERKLVALDNRIGRHHNFLDDVRWRSSSPPTYFVSDTSIISEEGELIPYLSSGRMGSYDFDVERSNLERIDSQLTTGPIASQPPARLLSRREYTGLQPGEALLAELNHDLTFKSILRPKHGFQEHIKSRVKAVEQTVASMRHHLEVYDQPPDHNINYGKRQPNSKRFCSKRGLFPG